MSTTLRNRLQGRGDALLALPLALFFFMTFVSPLVALFLVSLFRTPEFRDMGLDQYVRFLADPFSLRVLAETLELGVEVAGLSMVLAYPLGLAYLASGPTARTLITFLIIMPMLTSAVVRTFAWIVILGREGIVNNGMIALGLWSSPARLLYTWHGMIVALVQIQLPLMVLPIINSLLRIDPNLISAAEGLGASRFRVFRTIIIPLTLPGLVAGGLLVFAAAVTAFITQTLVGGGRIILMPYYIYQQAVGVQEWPYAAALSIIFAIAVIVVVATASIVASRQIRGVDAS